MRVCYIYIDLYIYIYVPFFGGVGVLDDANPHLFVLCKGASIANLVFILDLSIQDNPSTGPGRRLARRSLGCFESAKVGGL